MRRVILCLAALCLADVAAAADLDESYIRGSDSYQPQVPTNTRWEGFYAGGQVGYSSAGVDFGTGLKPLIDFALRNLRVNQDINVSSLTVLGKRDTNGSGFGGFVGYNMQFGEAILGVELNYSRMRIGTTASDSLRRVFPDTAVSANYVYDISVAGQSSIRITDLATVRGRGGWSIGSFMPYAFVGMALGLADTSSSAQVAFCGYDPTANPPSQDPPNSANPCYTPARTNLVRQPPATESKTGQLMVGGAAGLGVEVQVARNVFARGEWEYVQFVPIQSTRVYLNSFRTAIGVLF